MLRFDRDKGEEKARAVGLATTAEERFTLRLDAGRVSGSTSSANAWAAPSAGLRGATYLCQLRAARAAAIARGFARARRGQDHAAHVRPFC